MKQTRSISSNEMLKSIMRLMCIFSLFALICDILDLFFEDTTSVEAVYDILHFIQYFTVIFFLFRHKINLEELHIYRKSLSIKNIFISLLIGFFTSALGSSLDELMPKIPTVDGDYSFIHTILFMFFAGIMAPIFEEIEFRGLLFRSLKGRMQTVFAILLSSLMFMVLHTGGILISAFIVGIISAIVFLWTNNLIYSMLIHFAGNSIAVMMIALSLIIPMSTNDVSDSVNETIETSSFWAPEMIVLNLLPAAILFVLLIFLYKRTNHSQSDTKLELVNEKMDYSILPYFIFYFVICVGSTIAQFVI